MPSCSVNVLGGTWHSLMWHRNFPDGFETEEYYGFAVDYRGATPIVYVIVRSQVVDTIPLSDVTERKPTSTLPVINRYNHLRKVEITANMAPGVSQGEAIARCAAIAEGVRQAGALIARFLRGTL